MNFYKKVLIAVLMVATSGTAMALRPTHRIADEGPAVNLEVMIPKRFGDWQEEPQQSGQIINPQIKAKLESIYTQTLSRSYINTQGERIMLSIAYGADQSDAKQLHYPEVCYPAQGFQVVSTQPGLVKTSFGDIRVKRLQTVLGNRSEPLTYWSTVGNRVVAGGRETKLEQLRYGLRGQIPDGLLFRVSSISADAYQGYELQNIFLNEVIAAMHSDTRLRVAGIASNKNH